jgi:predicted MFS family arabinose efflux permease
MTRPPRPGMSPWVILVLTTLVAFIASGVRMSYGVFVIPLSDAFDLSRAEAALPLSLSMVVWGVVQPFTGAWMDKYGPRKIILASLVTMALGFVWASYSQSMWQLTIGYALLVGSASSGLAVAAFSILVSRWFGPEQRGKAIGIALAGIPVGSVLFAPLASTLAYQWSWQTAFLFLAAALVLIALPLTYFFLREPPSTPEARKAAAARAGSLFSPEVRRALKTRAYWLLLIAYFGCGSTGWFLYGHLPAIAMDVGLSPQQGATGLGLVGVGGAFGAVLGGWAADRFGRYHALAGGYLVRALGGFFLVYLVHDVTTFFIASLVAGLAMFITITVTQLLIYEIFGAGIAGRMIGLTFVLHQVGSTIGPYLGGRMYDAQGSYTAALLASGVILLMSSFLGWRLKYAIQVVSPEAR